MVESYTNYRHDDQGAYIRWSWARAASNIVLHVMYWLSSDYVIVVILPSFLHVSDSHHEQAATQAEQSIHCSMFGCILTLIDWQHYLRPQRQAENLNLPGKASQDPSFLEIYQQDQADSYSAQLSAFNGQYLPARGPTTGQYASSSILTLNPDKN